MTNASVNSSESIQPRLFAAFDKQLSRLGKQRNLVTILLFLFGACYPLGFAPFSFWWVTPISLLGLFIISHIQTSLSPFKSGFIWGFAMNLVGCSWVYVSIHRFGGAPWWGAGLLSLLFVAYLACFKGLFCWLCFRFARTGHWLLWVFMLALFWGVCEWLQSWLLTGFPWLLAGYSQLDGPLAKLATIGGVNWLSWWLIVCSALIAAFVLHPGHRKGVARATLLVLLGAFALQLLPAKTINYSRSDLTVSLVQPNVDQAKKWDRRYFKQIVDDLYRLSEGEWQSDLLIWPEGAIPAYYQQVPNLMKDLSTRAEDFQTNLVFGIPWFDEQSRRSYVALQVLGAQQQNYFKQVLVPFGEYVPMENVLRGLIRFFDLPMSGFSLPASPQLPLKMNGYYLLPAVCYEVTYPRILWDSLHQSAHKDWPALIVTVSNDAWFGDSLGPWQHKQMARMRALELGVPLVRGTNDGITMMTDSRGQVIAELPRHQPLTLRQNISTQAVDTLYRTLGDWPLIICLILSLVLNIWLRRRFRGESQRAQKQAA